MLTHSAGRLDARRLRTYRAQLLEFWPGYHWLPEFLARQA